MTATSTKTEITVQRDDKGRIFSRVRGKWVFETPEERVRQEWLCVLINEYGYTTEQMGEELDLTGRGSAQARADLVIWRNQQDKQKGNTPLLVIEYKSDNISISPADYAQGEMYARLCEAPFFVTHNNKESRFWRVRKDKMPGYLEEIESIPHADASDKQITAMLERLKVFREDEFADLLHRCHNIIRNRDHLDPAAAFDEIAKILFVKTGVERDLKKRKTRANLFSVDYLENLPFGNPINSLFDETKKTYKADKIFLTEEKITKTALKNSSAKLFPAGSILIAMYGQGATRGRTGKLGIKATTNQACCAMYDFAPEILPDFLWYFLMAEYDRLRAMASGNNQPNLNAGMIANYRVPLPPLDVQRTLITSIGKARADSLALHQQAKQLREQAKREIEAALLGNVSLTI